VVVGERLEVARETEVEKVAKVVEGRKVLQERQGMLLGVSRIECRTVTRMA
jgi:hypothetical protein